MIAMCLYSNVENNESFKLEDTSFITCDPDELVAKVKTNKKIEPPPVPGPTCIDGSDLKPCPAYVPVPTQRDLTENDDNLYSIVYLP